MPIMQPAIAHHLRHARLGHALLEVLPGAVLRIGRIGGPSVDVAALGTVGGDTTLPCQHRAALGRAMESGLQRTYAHALGLTAGGDLTVELLAPAGSDLGTGVYATRERAGARRLVTATTLCPGHAVAAARAAKTRPVPAAVPPRPAGTGAEATPVRMEVGHDPLLGVTLLSWVHRPHPAVCGHLEDAARAAAAACAVEELLHTLA